MDKHNRPKRRPAKIQQRKQRQKRTQKPSTRLSEWDPLHDLASEMKEMENFSNLKTVINPPDQEKMSEVLEQFIEPYMGAAEDIESMKKLVIIAVIAWNAALMADDRRATFLDQMLDSVPKELREDVVSMIGGMIRRKNRYFADNQRPIVNARVTDTGDGFYITVASLMHGEEPYQSKPGAA